jgi:hypothetical protein
MPRSDLINTGLEPGDQWRPLGSNRFNGFVVR